MLQGECKLAAVCPATLVSQKHITFHPSLFLLILPPFTTSRNPTAIMKLSGRSNCNAGDSGTSTAVPSPSNSMDIPAGAGNTNIQRSEKGVAPDVDGHLSVGITFGTVIMAILVAMGGFIFGYDTGQISGFLEMRVFLERFGQQTEVSTEHPYGYYFTNVRSGLIVALVG